MNYVRPSLTEPGVTYFLQETLKQCKEKREIFNTRVFNLVLFGGFTVILASLLYYKYSTR